MNIKRNLSKLVDARELSEQVLVATKHWIAT